MSSCREDEQSYGGWKTKIIFELRDRAPGYLITLLMMLFALLGKLERWYFLLLNYWGMLSSHQQAEYLQYDEGCYGVNGPFH